MPALTADTGETAALLEQVQDGDPAALGQLLERHRGPMLTFVERRIDGRLRARIDPSDVVQEAQLEMTERIDDYIRRRPMPFRVWATRTAHERLLTLRRDHVVTQQRSVMNEVGLSDAARAQLAADLSAGGASPSRTVEYREIAGRTAEVLAELAPADQEIMLMRHVEGLPYEEIGCILGIEPAAARKRYGRALIRLQKALSDAGILEADDE